MSAQQFCPGLGLWGEVFLAESNPFTLLGPLKTRTVALGTVLADRQGPGELLGTEHRSG